MACIVCICIFIVSVLLPLLFLLLYTDSGMLSKHVRDYNYLYIAIITITL